MLSCYEIVCSECDAPVSTCPCPGAKVRTFTVCRECDPVGDPAAVARLLGTAVDVHPQRKERVQ